MMVKGEIFDGAVLIEDVDGDSEVQVWDVPAAGSGSAFLHNAKAHGAPPRKNQRHGIDPSLVVRRRTISDIGGGTARIRIEFEQGGSQAQAPGTVTDVRYDGTVAIEQRKTDIDGRPMISGLSAYSVGINVARAVVEVDRIERQPPGFVFLSGFMNHINATPFSGFPAYTVLMQAPRSRGIDGTSHHLVTYILAINLGTWDKTLEATRIESVESSTVATAFTPGTPLQVIKSVSSEKHTYRNYPLAEFARLGFSI